MTIKIIYCAFYFKKVQKKIRKILIVLLKILITLLSFLYIFYKLKQYNVIEFHFSFNDFKNYFIFFIVILLMPLNWFIESIKWKFLVRNIEKIEIKTSFKAVFSGITFAIFTPNRIGELAGRIFVLKKENRIKAIFATAAGSLSQQMITLFIGFIGGLLFLYFYRERLINIEDRQLYYIKIVSIILVIIGFLLLFNLKRLSSMLNRMKLSQKMIDAINVLASYSSMELFRVLLFSLLRYIVFLFQFFLLLSFFNIDIALFEAFICIALTYFVSSVIPTFTLTEIGIRGSAALFFLGLFSDNAVGILSATALLWIINLAIPAIIGSLFFGRTRI